MNIYDRLTKDHDRQRDLIEQICKTEGASADRKRLWSDLYAELEAHALAEEQVFYAELMEHPDGTEKARHSVAEHKDMSDIVAELDDMDMDSPGWLNRFHTLADQVSHHVDEEEEEVFPKARKLIGDDTAEKLAEDFDDRKAKECGQVDAA